MGIRYEYETQVQRLWWVLWPQRWAESDKFFLGVIGSRNQEFIQQIIESFNKDNDQLVDQVLAILYWYRGAITREDVWQLTPYEREKSIEFLNKRFKEAGDMIKKQIPVFL